MILYHMNLAAIYIYIENFVLYKYLYVDLRRNCTRLHQRRKILLIYINWKHTRVEYETLD